MRAVGVHPDVIVVTSRIWQTTCTLVRGGDETFCVDSPILPDELELLPTVAEQAGFRVVGLLCTHADWDHLLGRYAFADAPLGCADSSARVLSDQPGAAQRELRAFDEEHYVERPAPLTLPPPQALPVPGRCAIGPHELELHAATEHTGDGMAIHAPWAGVLAVGDYLSPVEIPTLTKAGSLGAYAETLERLEPLVQSVDWVIPGHGAVLEAARAAAILREDRAYLEALRERGREGALPRGRSTPVQRRIHRENVERVAG